MVREELGDACLPLEGVAMHWSKGFEADSTDARWLASYVSKFSCEVSGVAKDRAGGATPWEVADRASRGDHGALRLWSEYVSTTRGRRAVELDDRAAAAADDYLERQREKNDEASEGKSDDGHIEAQEVEVKRDELRSLRLYERKRPTIMWDVLHAAEVWGEQGVRALIAVAQLSTGTGPPAVVTWYARAG